MQQKNFIVFIVLSLLILFGWIQLQNWLYPPKQKKPQDQQKAEAPAPKPEQKPQDEPHLPQARDLGGPVIQLGDQSSKLLAFLDPWGAGVVSVTLNEFDQADALGKPDLLNGERKRMELVRGDMNRLTPSNLIYHFPLNNEKADRPLDTLGKEKWDVVEPNPIVPGQPVRRAVFTKTIRDVRITKTFELQPDDYHIGLEVKVELTEAKPESGKRTQKFRYQITGAHGVRMEGEWYASVLRNVHILNVDPKNREKPDRKTEELARLSSRSGGDKVFKATDMLIRYGAVATQFFTSAVAVDENQADQEFIEYGRGTVEAAWIKGSVTSIDPNGRFFELDTTPEPGFFGGQ